jgi:hypothetical protein
VKEEEEEEGGAFSGSGISSGRRRAVAPNSSPPPTAEPMPVLILTIAHLFDQAAATGGGAGSPPPSPAIRVRVSCPDTGRHAWAAAPGPPLHRFRSPHLDLAVLAVPYPSSSPSPSSSLAALEEAALLRRGLDALAPLELLPPACGDGGGDAPTAAAASTAGFAGAPIVVAGHGLFGPALGFPAAATVGSVARVVSVAAPGPQSADAAAAAAAAAPLSTAAMAASSSLPLLSAAASASTRVPPAPRAPHRGVMAVTTASVHAGASGAAVLCAKTGCLVAVATSNSRHMSPARPARVSTVPKWNYAVPSDALRPLWQWAQREAAAAAAAAAAGGVTAFDAAGARAALRAIDRRAWEEGGEAAARVWALLPPPESGGGVVPPRARL